ncbi:MAG: GWxTD domain-containing protein [Chloroherpetonaceae bacterium]
MKNKIKTIWLAILFFFSIATTYGQNTSYLNPNSAFYANRMIFGSTMVLPSQSPDSVEIFLFYKLQINHFLFTNIGDEYISKYTIELSLADSDGVVKVSRVISDSFKLSNPLTPKDPVQFRTNYIELHALKANYTAQIRVIDNSTKNSDKSSFPLNFSNLKNEPNSFTNIVFLENKGNYASPIILNNNLKFSGDPIDLYIFIFNDNNNDLHYDIIKKYNNPKAIDPWGEFQKHSGKLETQPFNKPTIDLIDNSIHIQFPIEASLPTAGEENNGKMARIIYQNNIFSPGDYILKIYNSKGDTSQSTFKVYWEDEPISLLNVTYALNISKLFFNEKEMDKIENGDYGEQYQNLIDAWKQFDPTPQTPFNEVMNEFYRRVDYAYNNFSTFSEKNGANTDKGRIYILYGPPDKTEQKFKNGKLYETWVYTTLIKEFTFETIESGVFKIVNIRE